MEFELEKNEANFYKPEEPSKKGVFERSKTPLRLKYEAECKLIKDKLGSLEDVRNNLGISQRKICQLLMVDPSAWSRSSLSKRQRSAIGPLRHRAKLWRRRSLPRPRGSSRT